MPLFSFMLISLAALIAYASLRQLLITIRKRGSALHLTFCLISVGVLGLVIGNLALINADSAAGVLAATRIRIIFGAISIALIPWFASYYTGYRPRPFLIAFSSLTLLFMVVRSFDPSLLTYTVILDPIRITLPWNEQIAVFNAKTNWWMYVYYAIAITCLAFLYASSLSQYRRGERGRALVVLTAVTLLVAAIIHDMVVILYGVHWILLGDFGWLIIVLLLDIRLTDDIIKAGEIKKSLVESERTLRLSEEKYRLLAENVTDVIWTMDMAMKTTYITPSIQKLLGWSVEEWMGLSLDRFLSPESIEKTVNLIRKGLERTSAADYDRNRVITYELEQYRKDGTTVWTEISAKFTWDQSARPSGIIGITRDISERKEAEAALLARNRVLTAINRLGIELTSLPSGEGIYPFLARELKEVSGAEAVSMAEYDEVRKCLVVRHIELGPSLTQSPGTAEIISSLLAAHPINEASYNRIMSDTVQRWQSLTEVTFGSVSPEVSEYIRTAFGMDRYIGTAYIYEGTLYGASILAMKQGSPDPQEDLLRSFASIAAVSLRRSRAEERLMNSLEEKNILIKEIHHRVKNNLQVIVSLLAMQSDQISHSDTRSLYDESIARVHSMALIHESIYRSENFANIDMGQYVNELVRMILSTYLLDESRVKITINVKDVSLNVDRAVPCALLLNELISNALKHGIGNDGRTGRLDLSFTRSGERYILVVEDNGPGMDVTAFNSGEQKTLGLQLVKALAQQIGGTVDLLVRDGCRFVIEFPTAG